MKKVILSGYSYFVQVFIIFSVAIMTISLLGLFVGDAAKGMSTLFSLGSRGIALSTIGQLFLMSLIIAALNTIILSDKLLKNVMMLWKIVIMLVLIIITIICFILLFGWFAIDNLYAWVGFAISFGSGFAISTMVMMIKTKLENQKYERSFLEYKQRHKEACEDE